MNQQRLAVFLLSVLTVPATFGAEEATDKEQAQAMLADNGKAGDVLSPADSRHHVVEISEFRFSPTELTVRIGDTVEFINRDVVPHTVTELEKNWDSGFLGAEQSWTLKINQQTAAEYFCAYHPSMRGSLKIVR